MTCYAMACRQAKPCLKSSHCEKHWHACQAPDTNTIYHWTCGDCRATWTLHTDHIWHRDPLNGAKP